MILHNSRLDTMILTDFMLNSFIDELVQCFSFYEC